MDRVKPEDLVKGKQYLIKESFDIDLENKIVVYEGIGNFSKSWHSFKFVEPFETAINGLAGETITQKRERVELSESMMRDAMKIVEDEYSEISKNYAI